MELREEELTEEQLQQMIEFHSKNQTSHFAPSWIKSAATHGGALALIEVQCVPQLVV